MKKEVVCHVSTNEEGETVAVRKLLGDGRFFLFSAGGDRKFVINAEELVDAIGTIQQFSEIFRVEEARKNKVPEVQVQAQSSPVSNEVELHFNEEPTESDKDLERIMGEIMGGSNVDT